MSEYYTAVATYRPSRDSSINYEITIPYVGRTQAETADEVEIMVRDYLDCMGHNGDAELRITWRPGGTITTHRTTTGQDNDDVPA